MSYAYPEGVITQYKLNDLGWKKVDNSYLEFLGLESGDHKIELRAKKYNSNWSEIKRLQFTILAPWWQRWWAILIYITVFINCILGYNKWRSAKLEEDKSKLEKIVSERTNELELQKEEVSTQNNKLEEQSQKLLELDKIKSQFFANISHEFRTPLTLILDPLESLIPSINEDSNKKKAQIAYRNASSLLRLVNQLLDLSKIEERNIISDLNLYIATFQSLAEKKNINFEVIFRIKELFMEYDPEKLEIIINNLVSNAIKFTSEKGKISIYINVNQKLLNGNPGLEIKVEDNGIGMPHDNTLKIFDRFYQVDASLKKEYADTSIGLSLTKELVELHNGTIQVDSKIGKGSSFTIHLPVNIDQKEVTHANKHTSEVIYDEQLKKDYSVVSEAMEKVDQTKNVNKEIPDIPTILVVEDNPDLRFFMEDLLQNSFNIIQAENGLLGLKASKKYLPDLIVSDIMMPEMSGVEMYGHIKTNELTLHMIELQKKNQALEERMNQLDKE